MAQSQSELKENKNSRGRNKSTSNQMEMSKSELLDLDPIEVLDWEVEKLEAVLKELRITIGVSWSNSRKAHELNKRNGILLQQYCQESVKEHIKFRGKMAK